MLNRKPKNWLGQFSLLWLYQMPSANCFSKFDKVNGKYFKLKIFKKKRIFLRDCPKYKNYFKRKFKAMTDSPLIFDTSEHAHQQYFNGSPRN